LVSLEYFPIELLTFFEISGVFARLDVLSNEDWFSRTFNFKETDSITPNFLIMGSDNTIFLTNSGSFYGMLAIIFGKVLFQVLLSMIIGRLTRYRIARLIGMKTHLNAPFATLKSQNSVLLLEGYLEVALAVFINIQGWLNCTGPMDFKQYFIGFGNLLNSILLIIYMYILVAYLMYSNVLIFTKYKNIQKPEVR
jgi:hypothetical protein